jgi:hypothetical protein
MRSRSLVAAASICAALFATAVPAAQAAPPPNPGPPKVSVTVDDPSLAVAVTCEIFATSPT